MALPPATLRLLKALDAEPNKKLMKLDLCRKMSITHRGFDLLLSRVERLRYVDRDYTHQTIELTFGGMKALEAAIAKAEGR